SRGSVGGRAVRPETEIFRRERQTRLPKLLQTNVGGTVIGSLQDAAMGNVHIEANAIRSQSRAPEHVYMKGRIVKSSRQSLFVMLAMLIASPAIGFAGGIRHDRSDEQYV